MRTCGVILLVAILVLFCFESGLCGKTKNENEHKILRHYNIRVRNVICPYDTIFIHNATCFIKPLNESTHKWGLDIHMRDGFQVHELFMSNMKYRPSTIINGTIDLCSVLSGKSNSPASNMITTSIAKYSNILHPCPFEGHLYVREHIEKHIGFPPIIPAGDYRTHFIYYTKYKNADHIVFQIIVNYEVVPIGIERF